MKILVKLKKLINWDKERFRDGKSPDTKTKVTQTPEKPFG